MKIYVQIYKFADNTIKRKEWFKSTLLQYFQLV